MNFNFLKKTVILCALLVTSFSCTNDEPTKDDENNNALPVTIDLAGLGITLEQALFEVDGFDFVIIGGKSLPNPDNGVVIAYPADDVNPYLKLDLSTTPQVSKITIQMLNSCGGATCTTIQVLDSQGAVLKELAGSDEIPTTNTDVIIDNVASADSLIIYSSETFVYSITLE